MAAATKDKKAAAKKDDAAPAKKRAARPSAPLTASQAKVLEAQYDTRLKDARSLDEKLAEIEAKFPEENTTLVPTQVREARAKLADSITALEESRAAFAEIGEAMRSFFG